MYFSIIIFLDYSIKSIMYTPSLRKTMQVLKNHRGFKSIRINCTGLWRIWLSPIKKITEQEAQLFPSNPATDGLESPLPWANFSSFPQDQQMWAVQNSHTNKKATFK